MPEKKHKPFEEREHFELANKFLRPWMDDKRLQWAPNEDSKKVYYTLREFAKHTMCLEGDVVEFGVFRGDSAAYIQDVIPDNKILYLFDTFHGLPKPNENDIYWEEGDFSNTSLSLVREKIKTNASFQVGRLEDSIKTSEINTICFSHIDVDLYDSTKHAMEFVYPKLVTGGILVFDDYGDLVSRGAKKATDEFFKDKKEKPIYLTTKQSIVIKT